MKYSATLLTLGLATLVSPSPTPGIGAKKVEGRQFPWWPDCPTDDPKYVACYDRAWDYCHEHQIMNHPHCEDGVIRESCTQYCRDISHVQCKTACHWS